MIIVFFHVLYLLGKFIYKNYRGNDSNADEADENTGEINKSACGSKTTGSTLETIQRDPYSNFYDEEGSKIKFSPPAYIQRYHAVTNILSDNKYKGKIHKVVDFGCAELNFVRYMKNIKGIEEILCVDVDRNTLEMNQRKIEPLSADYLVCRDTPLSVHVYEGSVTDPDECLENCDAVICIELIEHLYPETLLRLPFNIFGFIKPQVAVFTTPNADFNVLFKGMKGYRHWDHKFEWTREQFQDWANNITTRYPDYEVRFDGVCLGPLGSEALGHCSQMAIFHRNSERLPSRGVPNFYKLVLSVEYPMRIDNRSPEEKMFQEASYFIRHYALNNEDEEMSLKLLAKWMDDVEIDTLRNMLEIYGWRIIDHEEKGLAVLCQESLEYSDFDEDDEECDGVIGDNYEVCPYNEDWDSEPSALVYHQNDWPEIYDQDEEVWENDVEDSSCPIGTHHLQISNDHTNNALSKSARSSIDAINYLDRELPSESVDINIGGLDFQDLESIYRSPAYSGSVNANGTSVDLKQPQTLGDCSDVPIDLKEHYENYSSSIVSNSNDSVHNTPHNVGSVISRHNAQTVVLKKQHNPTGDILLTSTVPEEGSVAVQSLQSRQLENAKVVDSVVSPPSMCSMYLEHSTCENSQVFSNRATKSMFDCSNVWNGEDICEEIFVRDCKKELRYSSTTNDSPNLTSTPLTKQTKSRKLSQNSCSDLNETSRSSQNPVNLAEKKSGNNEYNADKTIFEHCEKYSDSCTSCQREKIEVIKKLKGSVLMASLESDVSAEESNDLAVLSLHQAENFSNKMTETVTRLGSPEFSSSTLETNLPTKLHHAVEGDSSLTDAVEREIKILKACEECEMNKDVFASIGKILNEGSVSKSAVENASPETKDSPSSSWSPEIVDSGYPNTSSAHDITPECDLSSISHDKISEPQSPSIAEPLRPNFEQHLEQHVQVENGDLANNNRDGEGNNMIAAEDNDLDDLQPLIDVLENDLENENDIYDFQNGFPVWLLRILDAEAAAIHPGAGYNFVEEIAPRDDHNVDPDERLDNSSSDDSEEMDNNENVHEKQNEQNNTSDEDDSDNVDNDFADFDGGAGHV